MLDTRMLLKIVLDPEVYLLKDRHIKPEEELVFVDLVQFVQENILESALNHMYVSQLDIKRAMARIESSEVNSAGLERVLIHFMKLCFIVNMILRQRGYPMVKVIPTLNATICDTLSETVMLKGEQCQSWNLISDIDAFAAFFNKVTEGDFLWEFETIGSIFHEFPKSLNTLDIYGCLNTIVSSENDKWLMTILRSIYLKEKYDIMSLINPMVLYEDNKGGVRIEDNAYRNS